MNEDYGTNTPEDAASWARAHGEDDGPLDRPSRGELELDAFLDSRGQRDSMGREPVARPGVQDHVPHLLRDLERMVEAQRNGGLR